MKATNNNITEDEWVKHYKKVFSAPETRNGGEAVAKNSTVREIEELDKNFSMEELEDGIKRLGRKKSPGEDGIPNEVWKALGPKAKEALLHTMNTCFRGNLPPNWGTTITVPIHKKGNTEEPGNYRPIVLLNTSTKLFTTLIAKRVQDFTEKHGIIHDNQAAYRKGRGCEDHVYTLNAMIQKQLNQKSHWKRRKHEK